MEYRLVKFTPVSHNSVFLLYKDYKTSVGGVLSIQFKFYYMWVKVIGDSQKCTEICHLKIWCKSLRYLILRISRVVFFYVILFWNEYYMSHQYFLYTFNDRSIRKVGSFVGIFSSVLPDEKLPFLWRPYSPFGKVKHDVVRRISLSEIPWP